MINRSPHTTHERILQAATRAFALHGIIGATTREIARLAKVNEVTLFRYFKNKDQLLRAVVMASSQRYEDFFNTALLGTETDLENTVQSFAELYQSMLQQNEEFVRTFFGELNRYPKLGRRLFVEAARMKRNRFISYLRKAQKHQLVRRDVNLAMSVDALTGMLLAGALRRPLLKYSASVYARTCTRIFLKGIRT